MMIAKETAPASIVEMDQYRGTARSEMLAFIPDIRSRILEIGCGEGRFAASIPGTTETWGIEPDADSAKLATDRLSRVINGKFDEVSDILPAEYFDVVVCNDVIEHMPDHDQFLESVKRVIRPGGGLLGSVPNVRYYKNLFELVVTRDWEYRDMGILDRTHLRFFTERSLRRTLESHGFAIHRLSGINGGLWFGKSPWGIACRLFTYSLLVVSIGRATDVKYQQFAFYVTPKSVDGIT